MDQAIQFLLNSIVTGGSGAIISLLIVVIGFLIWDRRRILNELNEKDDKLSEVIHNYYEATIDTTKALDSLRMVLIEIKAKM